MKETEKLENMTEYQCGARKGKSVREHHFVIRSVIEEAKSEKKNITAIYIDIKNCFDKMILKEAMKELWIKGIRGKNWRMIYEMNRKNVLIPVTEIGECEAVQVEEMIRQGSVLSGKLSAITMDSLTRIIKEKDRKWKIGAIELSPLIFQDNIMIVEENKQIQKTINSLEV